jgi:tRNA pseudouridine13 synthase
MLPYRTPIHLSTGGLLKVEPEDFRVEEIPLYPATGTGEFLFVELEKRDVSAEELVRRLSRALGISRQDIGVAGMKDRRAVTRQRVSVPAKCEPKLEVLREDPVTGWGGTETVPEITVFDWKRHPHKLRTGHLEGNRFLIRLREVQSEAERTARTIAAAIGPSGFPNYFGDQRFGRDQETCELGRGLLSGAKSLRDISPARRRFLTRLALSAVQSRLFNDVLAHRLERGLFETVLPGDVLQVRASGGLFVTDDVEREQARLASGEVALTGPMFGPKMKSPTVRAAEMEAEVLRESGLTIDAFSRFPKLTGGTRRPLGIVPAEFDVRRREEPDSLEFRFVLPPGAYATTVLREFIKEAAGTPSESSPDEEPLASDDDEGE